MLIEEFVIGKATTNIGTHPVINKQNLHRTSQATEPTIQEVFTTKKHTPDTLFNGEELGELDEDGEELCMIDGK